MEVKMDEATYEYLKKKGGKLTMDLMVPAGCCGGTMVPNLIFNSPKDRQNSGNCRIRTLPCT